VSGRLPDWLPGPLEHALRSGWHAIKRRDPRRALARARFENWNAGAKPDTVTLRPGLTIPVVDEAREGFEYFAWRDLEMVREFEQFVRERDSGRRLLDVGALHGLFSLAFVAHRPQARALAVEPSAAALNILRRHVAMNTGGGIDVAEVAAGEATGQIRLVENWHHLEASPAGAGGVERIVEQTTLDRLCAARDFWPDVVKIDVEGMEGRVLRGAAEVLRRRPVIHLELHPQALERLGESVEQALRPLVESGHIADSGRFARAKNTTRIVVRPSPNP
jgi:FkbM family methyltransferase